MFNSVLLLLFLVSCQSTSGNKSTINLYQTQIKTGTKLASIIEIYGKYSGNWQDESGNNIYQYSYSKNGYDLVSYLPFINHFGWIKSQNYEVLLTFDSKDLLVSWQKFYNRAKSRNSLVCNPEIYSCLRKIY